MALVLGFGSTEEAFEKAEEAAIRAFSERYYTKLGLGYFDDKFVKALRAWLKRRTATLDELYEANRTAANPPARYSTYWTDVAQSASNVVVIMKIHHINRRHAMSPDGWALLKTKRLVLIESPELDQARQQSAA